MKKIYLFLILSILFAGCSRSSEQNITPEQNQKSEKFFFPEKTSAIKNILDSLGNLNEYKQNEFILYCRKDSYSDKNINHLFRMVDDAIVRVKKVLRTDHISRGFYLIMLDTREEMEKIVGQKYKGLALGEDDTAIFVYNPDIKPYFKHELFHLIAYHNWGKPESRVLNEGGAMFSDNECLFYENPISVINKYLYENNKWFSLDELINNFTGKAQENDMTAYLQAAYIFRHLYENYSKEKMIDLWRNGFSHFNNIYNININQLESDIKKEMENIRYNDIDWDELMEKGCG